MSEAIATDNIGEQTIVTDNSSTVHSATCNAAEQTIATENSATDNYSSAEQTHIFV